MASLFASSRGLAVGVPRPLESRCLFVGGSLGVPGVEEGDPRCMNFMFASLEDMAFGGCLLGAAMVISDMRQSLMCEAKLTLF